ITYCVGAPRKNYRMPNELQLSDVQRNSLFSFIERYDQIFGDGTFQRDESMPDEVILALSLRAAEHLGMEEREISEFFEREFNIAGMAGGDIGTCLALVMLADAEKRLIARVGGRN